MYLDKRQWYTAPIKIVNRYMLHVERSCSLVKAEECAFPRQNEDFSSTHQDKATQEKKPLVKPT